MILYGDSSELLKDLFIDYKNSIRTIYMDPPFNSNRKYNLNIDNNIGFDDIWKDKEYENWLENIITQCIPLLIKDGSFFLHISAKNMFIPEKILRRNFIFVNPIFWKKCRSKNNVKNKLGATIDIIFWCSLSNKPLFNIVYQSLNSFYLKNSYKNKDSKGYYALGHLVNDSTRKTSNKNRLFSFEVENKIYNPKNGWRLSKNELEKLIKQDRVHFSKKGKNLYKKIYKHESKGKACTDLWDDIFSIAQGNEKRLYPTEKPILLLERIIAMSSNKEDIILDPVAGSGTTGLAASNLNRKYILIDNNKQAIEIMKERINGICK